ncbi:hypothetical protein [Nonomuraea sp. SYSU D8015]|uniref:hypothetical protein n=1 Tax=Nonomuraea sp. SYSU D8015 TaxID=2593644 RepID=UPI001660A787|nr:hypothetical protein [Nonomuraea sp. SYSU D8015]
MRRVSVVGDAGSGTSALAAGGWVVDGDYSLVSDLVWSRADTVVWIDLPRHIVMRLS